MAPISPWRWPMVAEMPPRFDTWSTPCSTMTSPLSARLCASISPRPETPALTFSAAGASAGTLRTVSARPTMRAFGSVGRNTAAGTAPTMPSSSIASEAMPVRSGSARKPSRISAGSAGRSNMPKASAGSLPSVSFAMAKNLKAEQLGRIIDQHELARAGVGRDLGDEIGELAVVGHLARLVVRMRPVGAPDDALRRVGGERARERQGLFVRMRVLGDAVAAGEFDPDIAAVEQAQQPPKRAAVQAFGDIDAPHMVDHHRRLDRGDEIVVIDEARAADVIGDMPAVRRDLLDDRPHLVARPRRAAVGKIPMQPHATHAGVVEPFHLGVRRRRLEQRDAAIAILTGFEQVDKHPVVAAVRRRLHEHAALETQEFVQPEQIFLGG